MRWTIALLVIVQLLLFGCAEQPLVVGSDAKSGVADTLRVSAEPARANPYLRERDSVSVEAQHRFTQTQGLIEKKEWSAALLELRGLAESYPRLSGPCLNLALVYRQLGDADQAQHWFQKSIDNNARNISAYDQYGIFLREQGRFDEAETIYLMALEQWEASADTHRNIGILYDLYVGEPGKALRHYYRYQILTGDKDREVAGWIADLERRHRFTEEGAQS